MGLDLKFTNVRSRIRVREGLKIKVRLSVSFGSIRVCVKAKLRVNTKSRACMTGVGLHFVLGFVFGPVFSANCQTRDRTRGRAKPSVPPCL